MKTYFTKLMFSLGICVMIFWNQKANAQSWLTAGNAGTTPGTDFVGTTDPKSLYFKTNNKTIMAITSGGKVGIGTTTPTAKFQIKGNSNISQLIIDANATQSNTQPLIRLRNASSYDLMHISSDDSTNTFVGWNTGRVNLVSSINGKNNSFFGSQAGYSNTNGYGNTAVGYLSLYNNTTGHQNTANGVFSLQYNTTGNDNLANGIGALQNNTTGSGNAANGNGSLMFQTTGNNNTACGNFTLNNNTTGSNNTAIGAYADVNSGILTNATAIGYYARVNTSNSLVLGSNANVGIGTSSPTAKLHVADSSVVFAASGDVLTIPGNVPISNAGRRMMWYADKAAFRVGYVPGTDWNKDSIGNYSFAAGNNNRASGITSTALGQGSKAIGYVATAIGVGNNALGMYSIALGYQSISSGAYTISCGSGNYSRSGYETALGSYNTDYTPVSNTGWNGADRLLVIGNGSSDIARHNALTILKNGNVGLGTSTPTSQLDILPSSANALQIQPWGINAGNTGEFRVTELAAQGNNYTGFKAPDSMSVNLMLTLPNTLGTNNQVLATDGTGKLIWKAATGVTYYAGKGINLINDSINSTWTTAGANISNNNTGNVGIGTNSPNYKLDVFGNINCTGTLTANKIVIISDSLNNLLIRDNVNSATGIGNTAIGLKSGNNITTGSSNTFLGDRSGVFNSNGSLNVFVGHMAGFTNVTGSKNVFVGDSSGFNSTGSGNNFLGYCSGLKNTTGNSNVFVGDSSGYKNTTGNTNTYVGFKATGNATLTNATAIGANASVTASNSVVLGNNANVGIGTSAPNAKLDIAPSNANAINVQPFGTSAENTGELRFDELSANGNNYVGFKASDNIAANTIYTLPSADGTTGQVLKTNGAGVLSWVTNNGAPYTAGTGISVASNIITNTGDVNAADDITNTTTAAGDLSGTYPNPSVNKIKGVNVSATAPTNGQALKYNSASTQWEPSTDNNTAYTAGAGISVASNVIINTGDVNTADDITNSTTAAGDLSGTYPSPSVNKIKGVSVSATAPTNGQALKYNSATTQWEPSTDNNSGGTVTSITAGTGLSGGTITGSGNISAQNTTALWNANQLQGRNVVSTAPTNGQILKYDTVATQWVPSTDNNSGGTVTSIIAGTGLSGGTITGTGTISAQNTTALWNANQLQGTTVAVTAPTTGQVLKYDGSNWKPDIDNGTVYTAGTGISIAANTINSVWTQSGSNIYKNNAGHVGIGISTPQSTLHLHGTSPTSYLMQFTTTTTGSTAADGTALYPSTNDFVLDNAENGALRFRTNGAERMRINASGNMGIGTAVPGDKLSIKGGAISFHHQTNDVPYVGMDFDTINDGLRLLSNVLSTSLNTTNMFISRTDGNVGIGTLTHNKARFQVEGVVGNTVAIFKGNSTSQGISLIADYPGLFFNCYFNGGVKTMSASGYSSYINTEQTSGALTFNTTNVANATADMSVTVPECMRISGNGNVGIGTTTPSYKLEVAGNDAKINNVRVGRGNGSAFSNTCVGDSALQLNTSGGNSAFGKKALYANTTGFANTAVGANSLMANTNGSENTAVGALSLDSNTTGKGNTAIGSSALSSNSSGNNNTSVGRGSMAFNTTGSYNSALGYAALYANTTGSNNTVVGDSAGTANQDGYANTFIGDQSGHLNVSGYGNTFTGASSGQANLSNFNSFYGTASGIKNTTGTRNSYFGYWAGRENVSGNDNTYFGYGTFADGLSSQNTFVGSLVGNMNCTGSSNTFLGYSIAGLKTAGNANTFVGKEAGIGDVTGSNNTYVGYQAQGGSNYTNSGAFGNGAIATASNMYKIGNDVVTQIGGHVDWSNLSDGRFKKNLKPYNLGLDFIMKLNPVSYNFTFAGDTNTYHGFVAQDVEKILNDLNTPFSGLCKPQNKDDRYALRYAEFVVPIVNAIKEQQKQIESKDETISGLQASVQDLENSHLVQQNEINDLKHQIKDFENALSQCCTNFNSETSNPKSGIQNDIPRLEQNAPNPFSENTVIKYYLPASVKSAVIKIISLNGDGLKTFTLEQRGVNQLIISGNSLSPGTYTYTMIADEKVVESKLMTLTK